MEIKKVTDKKELLKVILFLKSAFAWATNKANKLNKNLIENNKNLGVYGYCIKNKNNNILGALLIFYQGNTQYKGKAGENEKRLKNLMRIPECLKLETEGIKYGMRKRRKLSFSKHVIIQDFRIFITKIRHQKKEGY